MPIEIKFMVSDTEEKFYKLMIIITASISVFFFLRYLHQKLEDRPQYRWKEKIIERTSSEERNHCNSGINQDKNCFCDEVFRTENKVWPVCYYREKVRIN